jgi:magnesium chelatase family protein
MQHWQLSARGFFRVLKMARTIADLDGARNILREHLLEAMTFRFPRHQAE